MALSSIDPNNNNKIYQRSHLLVNISVVPLNLAMSPRFLFSDVIFNITRLS